MSDDASPKNEQDQAATDSTGKQAETSEAKPAKAPASASRVTVPDQVEFNINEQNAKNIMDRLLREMSPKPNSAGQRQAQATDLHINVGRSPDYRIERQIRSVKAKPFTREDVILLSNSIMTEAQRGRFEQKHCIDMSYHVDQIRFRVNIVESFIGRSISIRRFDQIKNFEDYHLPKIYLDITEGHRGFVVMSGSSGSGKTTSIAAMLDHINRNFHRKIVTIEDPIEYVYRPQKSIVVQMEIGEDGIPNEEIALRNLVRMDPDVGLAGEMRDRQSLEAAVKTAQAGHLIFGTLHCEAVAKAFDRILAYFDTVEQQRILGTLADNLAAIINQRLLPCLKPEVDVVPAYEIFLPNPLARRYLREMRYMEAVAEMEKPAMKEAGCVTYVDSLYKLVTEEWVDYGLALEVAGDAAEKLKAKFKGIDLK